MVGALLTEWIIHKSLQLVSGVPDLIGHIARVSIILSQTPPAQ